MLPWTTMFSRLTSVFGAIVLAHCCAPVSLTAQWSHAPTFTIGLGNEELNGGNFRDRQKFVALVGADIAWTLPVPALTMTTGVQLERHYGANALCVVVTGCAPYVPDLNGVRGVLGLRYASHQWGTIGIGVGGGYLSSSESGPSGSRFRFALAEWEARLSARAGLLARVERLDLPDFGGSHLYSYPVSIALRVH